jgi:hypothetical protein
MVLFFQIIVNPNLSYAKPIDTLGRVFNVQDFIDASGADDELGIKRCLTTAAMQNHNQVKAHITILFPARVYQISGSLYPVWNLNEKAFYMRPDITNHIGRYAQINILGLTVDNATLKSDLGSMISGSFQTYINGTSWVPYDTSSQANYLPLNYHNYGYTTSDSATEIAIKNYINSKIGQTTIQHNVSTPVSSATFLTMPNPTIAVEIQSNNPNNHHFFVIDGAGKAGTSYYPGTYVPNPVYGLPSIPPSPPNNGELYNTAINIAGFRLKGIDTGNNSHIYSDTLIQHDSTFNMGKAICLENFKSYYIDNNIIEDVYGTGINISNKLFSYINGPVEVHHNFVKNVWGLMYKDLGANGYDKTGDGINFQGIKDGVCQYNIVNNDISITKQYGRIGIGACSEHTMNTECSYNMASGYDRGIHIENGLGGYKIHHNRLTGSETGIVFDGNRSYRNGLYPAPDSVNYHHCPFFNPSHIHHNYISNERDTTIMNSNLIKLYPPNLIWASHSNASNEHRGSIIEDNELVIDKKAIQNYVECSAMSVSNVACNQIRLITLDQPRYHIQSGLREQKIICNAFKVINESVNPSFTAGGTSISSEPGRINYQEAHPFCSYTSDPVLPVDTINGPDSIRLIFDLQYNNYINCSSTLWLNWPNSTPEQQARIPANTFNISPPCSSSLGIYQTINAYTNGSAETNISCCRQPNQLGMKNLYNTKSSYLHYALSNETFFVNGTYTIDQSTTFTSCTFYLAPNAKITVAAGQTLTLNGCTLKAGCNAMWDGIYASDPSSEIVIENGSTLQDMEHGVVVSGQAKLKATNSTFTNSYNGIQLLNLPSTFNGIIQNCTFSKTGTLLPRSTSTPNPLITGIRIVDCEKVIVGDEANPNLKNDFESLQTGIHIENNLTTSGLSDITTNYNSFTNIIGNMHIWDYPFITNDLPLGLNPAGCAIFGINNVNTHQVKLNHKGNNNPSNIDFETCYKAIVLNSIQAQILENYTYQTEAAFLVYSTGQTQVINYNHIDDTYLGVHLSGSHWGGINENIITNIKTQYFGLMPGHSYWGKGINWQQFSPSTSGGLSINSNHMSTAEDNNVVGMDISNTQLGNFRENHITFSSTSSAPSQSIFQNLLGISLNRSSGLNIEANNVQGTNGMPQDERRTCGIVMQQSPNNYLHCNINDGLQRGITIVGDCKGYNFSNSQINAGIEQNRVTTTRFGWLFRHLTTNGTLGDVGEQGVYDANNKFYNLGSNDLKVHRVFPSGFVCDPFAPQPRIYTNSSNLDPGGSTTNIVGNAYACSYYVENINPGVPFICNPAINIAPDNTGSEIDLAKALEIANNDIDYTEFADMGENYDERALFAYLVKDLSMLTQYPVLNQFYLANVGGSIDYLNQVDNLIAQLMDPITLENVPLFDSLFLEANTINNGISDNEFHVQNEKQINGLQLKAIAFGQTALLPNDWEWISDLAQECPFVAGIGVYKARMLNTSINPLAYFDDLKICNSVGVAKNSTGLFDVENAALDSMKNTSGGKLLFAIEGNQIKVFPNPASNNVTISYHLNAYSHAQFQLLDMQGRILKEIFLLPSSNQVNFSVTDLAEAMYNYRILLIILLQKMVNL